MDNQKLAYDLALQFSSCCLNECFNEIDSKEELADSALKSFDFCYNYLCDALGVEDR